MEARERIVSGSIPRALTLLAAPILMGQVVHLAHQLVDVMWVGPLGVEATGAVMTSVFTLWLAFSLTKLFTVGISAFVAQAIGAGDAERAARDSAHCFALALIVGAVTAVVGGIGAPWLFELMETDAYTSELGTTYLRIVCLGTPFSCIYLAGATAMSACGNTVLPMRITIWTLILNAVLTPVLVFGIGPAPELGVTGSAISTVSAQAAGAAAYIALRFVKHPDLPLDVAALRRPDPQRLAQIVRVGVPFAAVVALYAVIYLWYAHLAALQGAAAVALLGIANRIESVGYMTGDAAGSATATFVGQNLGAERPDRALRGTWGAAGASATFGALVAAAFILFPDQLLGAFTGDDDVLAMGATYLAILAICQPLQGIEGPLHGAFTGAAHTVPPMVIHVVAAVVRIPLGWWAAVHLGHGIMGIAWTMAATAIVRGVALAVWFHVGSWRRGAGLTTG